MFAEVVVLFVDNSRLTPHWHHGLNVFVEVPPLLCCKAVTLLNIEEYKEGLLLLKMLINLTIDTVARAVVTFVCQKLLLNR